MRRIGGAVQRVSERPDPASWGPDELMTLGEAAALFWPRGPLVEKSLRAAIRAGQLPYVRIARRLYVNREAIAEMSRCERNRSAEGPAPPAGAVGAEEALHERVRRRLAGR